MRLRILGVLGIIALLASCGSKPDGSGQQSDAGDASGTTAVSSETGALKAVVLEGKPFAMKEGETYEGLAVDVINAIKDESGLDSVSYVPVSSIDEGLNAVTTGEADIACGVSFTWDRARSVSYSLPFAISGTRLLAGEGVDGTPESLMGKTVGVVRDSASAKVLNDVVPNVELTDFASPTEALEAFNSGKVDVLGGPSLWLASSKGDSGKSLVPVRPYGSSGVGCIVKQDNGKLLSSANLAIGQMMQAYVDGDPGSQEMVNQWVGPGSAIDLKTTTISALYRVMLASTAEISTNVMDPAETAAMKPDADQPAE